MFTFRQQNNSAFQDITNASSGSIAELTISVVEFSLTYIRFRITCFLIVTFIHICAFTRICTKYLGLKSTETSLELFDNYFMCFIQFWTICLVRQPNYKYVGQIKFVL